MSAASSGKSSRLGWLATAPACEPLDDPALRDTRYRQQRRVILTSVLCGYGFLYTCRLPLSVVKKPLIDEGLFDAATLGQVRSTFALGYAAGKLADHANVRKLFALCVLVSALVNLPIPLSLTP